ncbi:MAG: hypothetical protein QM773_03145 [Hyphomonadaceae bacterium]
MSRYIIATREFELAGDPPEHVLLEILEAHPDGVNWRCGYHVTGLNQDAFSFYGMGVDAVQALHIAMQNAASILYTSEEYKAGRLTWLGMRNLGLPTADTIAHLVPQ